MMLISLVNINHLFAHSLNCLKYYCNVDACRNMFNTIKTSGRSSLEKYTSHFIRKGLKGLRKVLLCERWVGDWTEMQHFDPHSSGHSSISFPFSWAAQPGVWGPSLCWDIVLIPAYSLQLIWTSCHRGYIIIWPPPTSCERHICTQFNLSTVKFIPWSPDIFDRMHLLFTQVHFLFWQLGRGLYVTLLSQRNWPLATDF